MIDPIYVYLATTLSGTILINRANYSNVRCLRNVYGQWRTGARDTVSTRRNRTSGLREPRRSVPNTCTRDEALHTYNFEPKIMASILNFTKTWFRKKPLTALRFPTSGFDVVRNDVALEEERFEEFQKGLYYPVNIGNVFASRYQIVGKLGYGATSTVWLARDLE